MDEAFKKALIKNKDPFPDFIGQENVKKELISALLAGRHVLLGGLPGVGKTVLAKSVAKLLPEIEVVDCGFNCLPNAPTCPKCKKNNIKKIKRIKGLQRFIRIQGSPDLTVEDIFGEIDPIKALKFGPTSDEAFTPGKIFKANNGILFFDELNRCPEKLQNALLQVLEEKQVTLGAYTIDFPVDFIFIGTFNPEDTGTEKLSDVLLDRFDIIWVNYPESAEDEKKIVLAKGKKFDVEFEEKLIKLIIDFVRYLRDFENLIKKPSVRASIGAYERTQTNAILEKKKSVSFENVENAIISVLASRIKLKPGEGDERKFLIENFKNFASRYDLENDFDFEKKDFEKRIEQNEEQSEENEIQIQKTNGENKTKQKDEAKQNGKLIGCILLNGIKNFSPEFFYEKMNKNFSAFKENFGEKAISLITGLNPEQVEKCLKLPEAKNKIKVLIENKIDELKENKLIDANGNVTEKGIELGALALLNEEIKRIKKFYSSGKLVPQNSEKNKSDLRKWRKSDSYRKINIRASIKKALRQRKNLEEALLVNEYKNDKNYNILLALDASASMAGKDYKKIKMCKRAGIALAYEALKHRDRVGLLVFNSDIAKAIPPTNDLNYLLSEIVTISPFLQTNIQNAIFKAMELCSTNAKQHLIMVTDALPTVGKDPEKEVLNAVAFAASKGISISVIGIELDSQGKRLAEEIVKIAKGNLYIVKEMENLDLILLQDWQSFRN